MIDAFSIFLAHCGRKTFDAFHSENDVSKYLGQHNPTCDIYVALSLKVFHCSSYFDFSTVIHVSVAERPGLLSQLQCTSQGSQTSEPPHQ